MKNNLKGINWILASLVLIVLSSLWTLVSQTDANVLIFTGVYSVASIVLVVLCYRGYSRNDRRWAIAAMASGLFIVGLGIFGTALDLLNEASLASGVVLLVGGIIGANN